MGKATMTATTDHQQDVRRLLARLGTAQRSPRQFLHDAYGAMVRPWSAAGPLPSVIIPGTMRGGTTSLYRYLAGHPQIAPSIKKEVHYFDLHCGRGDDWYRRQFVRRPGGSAARGFESSPYYMFEPRVPARVRSLVPDAKLVFLLRDPVERAFSHYQKNRRDGREPLEFAEAIRAEDERLAGEEERMRHDPAYVSRIHQYYSYRGRGQYAEQLVRWREHFPEAQTLVLDAAALYADPRRTLSRVVAFLGLDPWTPPAFEPHNAGRHGTAPPPEARAMLESHFADHERRLVDLIGWCPSRSGAAAAA